MTVAGFPNQVAKLARAKPNRWREVALLAGAKSARGAPFSLWALVEKLCPHDVGEEPQSAEDAWGALIAGQALVESADLEQADVPDRQKLARVQSHLVHILESGQLPAVERVDAGLVLARLGDPRSGVGLGPDGLPDVVWCQVPAGAFVMGEGDKQHEVTLPVYRVAKYPVTCAQFQAFVEAGGYGMAELWPEATQAGWWRDGKFKGRFDDKPRDRPYDYGSPFNLPNHPVVGVSWYECLAFCRWLTGAWRESGVIDSDDVVCLPTEAEWEKAVRGTDGRRYPWGEEPDPDRANYDETGIGATSAVGCFPGGASPYGCQDMSGNVWEWTSSLYEPYPYNPEDGRENPDSTRGRVLRGGAFFDGADLVRCAARDYGGPALHFGNFGFRVVVSPISLSPL